MSNYGYIDQTVTVEHDNQEFVVTMRHPFGNPEWEVKAIRIASMVKSDEDSMDISEWLAIHAMEAYGEIVEMAEAKCNEPDADKFLDNDLDEARGRADRILEALCL